MSFRLQAASTVAATMIAFTSSAYATSLCPSGSGGLDVCGSGSGFAASPNDLIVDGVAYRSYDGIGNNIDNPDWGAVGSTFDSRAATEGTSFTREDGPSARDVSTSISSTGSTGEQSGLSNLFWAWGQFIDHDITLTEESHTAGKMELGGDMGTVDRSLRTDGALTNSITAYLDGSMVYGSDAETATRLRANDGSGQLLLDENGNLPRDENGEFLAGDIRVNEQQQLTAMHTVFAREHNRIAETLAEANPDWSGERIYQESRTLVGAQIQAVTYNEWLPQLLGEDAMGAYTGYDSSVNASLTNEFSTCAFRFCHSMIPDELERLAENGDPIAQGHLQLRDGFFNPEEFIESGGVDPLMRGLAASEAMAIDAVMSDELRNFLNAGNGEDGDLMARNIMRARDHGLEDYNTLRAAYGLDPITSWEELSDDPAVIAELRALYGETPDGLDPWLGGLLETPENGALVGALNATIIGDQFDRLRSGDRFWYENLFSGDVLSWINNRSLSDILRDNSGIEWLQNDAFIAVARGVVSAPGGIVLFVVSAGWIAARRRRSMAA